MPRPQGEEENSYIRLARVLEKDEAHEIEFAEELEAEVRRDIRGRRNWKDE